MKQLGLALVMVAVAVVGAAPARAAGQEQRAWVEGEQFWIVQARPYVGG